MTSSKINQVTDGDLSPTIIGDNNLVGENFYISSIIRASKEVKSIMGLISLLSAKSVTELKNITKETETEKNLKLKIDDRFLEYRGQIHNDFKQLHYLYAEAYEDARQQSEINDAVAGEIANYLIHISRKALNDAQGNPIAALDNMAANLENELKTIDDITEVSNGAVRYYLLMELIGCNVFPNPIE